MTRTGETAGWHVARWGALGWIETGVKSLAFLCAYVALAHTDTTSGWSAPHGVRIVELVLLGAASLGLLAAIGDRLLEREIVAMVFVCSTTQPIWRSCSACSPWTAPAAF